MRFIACLAAASILLVTGCDTGDDSPGPDAADSADSGTDGDSDGNDGADPVTPINALGDECSSDADCPDSRAHLCVFLQSGAPDRGYCSPVCQVDADCAADYTGPETGQLSCFLPSGDPGCTIVCTGDEDCPSALQCKITGGPVNVCATAAE